MYLFLETVYTNEIIVFFGLATGQTLKPTETETNFICTHRPEHVPSDFNLADFEREMVFCHTSSLQHMFLTGSLLKYRYL